MRFILLLKHCRSISDYKFVITTAVVNLLDYLTTLLPISIKLSTSLLCMTTVENLIDMIIVFVIGICRKPMTNFLN